MLELNCLNARKLEGLEGDDVPLSFQTVKPSSLNYSSTLYEVTNMFKYSKKTLKRFSNPKFAGEIKNPNAVGEEGNLKCGDMMRIFLRVDKKKGIIKDIKFQTYGCVAAIAATDALCEIAKGMTLETAKKLTWKEVIGELGEVPPIKYHCSIMGIGALQDAIRNYEKNVK